MTDDPSQPQSPHYRDTSDAQLVDGLVGRECRSRRLHRTIATKGSRQTQHLEIPTGFSTGSLDTKRLYGSANVHICIWPLIWPKTCRWTLGADTNSATLDFWVESELDIPMSQATAKCNFGFPVHGLVRIAFWRMSSQAHIWHVVIQRSKERATS